MDKYLIEKVIKANNDNCPQFIYENALLDRNVVQALSSSFVKILNISKHNSNINNNLRLKILENIRKVCRLQPENHCNLNEDVGNYLSEIYLEDLKTKVSFSQDESTDRKVDAYLVKLLKNCDIESNYPPVLNPDIIQALINLNLSGVYIDTISNDIINWHSKNNKYMCLMKNLWSDKECLNNAEFIDDLSLKMKAEIEKSLLDICQNLIVNNDVDKLFENTNLINIIKKCAVSKHCFQMCCGILNFIFIVTNFDIQLQKFIPRFISLIKEDCKLVTFCALYPMQLNHAAVLLDFDLDILHLEIRSKYIESTLSHLKNIHNNSETELILLLSHFPQWFDLYFSNENEQHFSSTS